MSVLDDVMQQGTQQSSETLADLFAKPTTLSM